MTEHTVEVPAVHRRGMSPLEMIAEWRKGCSEAGSLFSKMFPSQEPRPAEDCTACTVGLIDAMQKHLETLQPGLRALRLWHWQQVIEERGTQRFGEKFAQAFQLEGSKEAIKLIEDKIAWHLSCVQTLNDFFPIGDTAEGDASK